jgi:hypothetical protein
VSQRHARTLPCALSIFTRRKRVTGDGRWGAFAAGHWSRHRVTRNDRPQPTANSLIPPAGACDCRESGPIASRNELALPFAAQLRRTVALSRTRLRENVPGCS